MPWELTILNYDGDPPRLRSDDDVTRWLSMGSLDDVRATISEVFPDIEWREEPALLDVMKASGSDAWKSWDEEFLAYNSTPKLKATYECDDVFIEMFNFEQPDALKYICAEVRGRGNPLTLLQSLCNRTGWSIVEVGRDGKFLTFDNETTN